MKQEAIKKNKDSKLISIIYWLAFAIITIICLSFVCVESCKPFKITEYSELKQVTYDNYKTQSQGEYYVFIYDNEATSNDWFKEVVLDYANMARTKSDKLPIYGYDYRAENGSNIKGDLAITEFDTQVPGLFKVKDGKVTTKYLSYSKTMNELTQALGK